MQVGSYAATLGIGGLDGPAQQPFPLLPALPDARGETPDKRQRDDLEQQQPPDADRQEAAEHLVRAGREIRVAVIRLEQQRLALGGAGKRIGLVELARRLFELVFRFVQMRQPAGDVTEGARAEHLHFRCVQGELLANQAWVIGENDAARRIPNFDADEPATQHLALYDLVELADGGRL